MNSKPFSIVSDLERLAQSDELAKLGKRLAAQKPFNLFDAIGVSTQELRHSNLLAFLLQPNESHGLSDAFLKRFLQTAISASTELVISPDEFAAMDLSDAYVIREWQNIDIFITSPSNRLAVVVENKINSDEHSEQLSRYSEIAKAYGHDAKSDRMLIGVFLTPRGSKPTREDYLPVSYESVCTHLEALCDECAFDKSSSPDILTVVTHYIQMLKNQNIVSDPEIKRMCLELYAEHRAAFDRVFAVLREANRSEGTGKKMSKEDEAVTLVEHFMADRTDTVSRQDIIAAIQSQGPKVPGQSNVGNAITKLCEGEDPYLVEVPLGGKGGRKGYKRASLVTKKISRL